MSAVSPETLNQGFQAFALTGFPNGIEVGGIGKQAVVYQVTSANLLALPTTKPVLVAAPGAGFVIVPWRVSYQYDYGTTAYTIGNADNAFQIEYVGKTTALFAAQAVTNLVDQTHDTMVSETPAAAGILATSNCANLGLELTLTGTTPALTLGDGVVYVNLEYSILTVF